MKSECHAGVVGLNELHQLGEPYLRFILASFGGEELHNNDNGLVGSMSERGGDRREDADDERGRKSPCESEHGGSSGSYAVRTRWRIA
jgi:hypothetical protein